MAAIEDHVRADPHITHRQLAEILKISTERIQHIMRNILHLRKVSVQWVPHLLTDEQMMTRRRMCEENLKMFSDGGQRIISQILTGDETWVYYYDVPSNREAKIWIFDDEERPKLAQKELHVKKIMYAIFFRSTGLVKSVKLGPRETVTANWYKDICLPQVFEIITNERPATGLRGLILHHDNARPHTAAITREYLEELNVKTMPHPPYSPDLAPCDFWLFRNLKKFLRGKRFQTESEIDSAVDDFFSSITTAQWRAVFEKWQERMERCIRAQGDYF